MAVPVSLIRADLVLLTSEKGRKTVGWTLVAALSPVILLVAALCCLASGAAEHNAAAADLCFLGGPLPEDMEPAYAQCICDMRESFATLDMVIAQMQALTPSGSGLNATQIKAAFSPSALAIRRSARRRPRLLWTALFGMR